MADAKTAALVPRAGDPKGPLLSPLVAALRGLEGRATLGDLVERTGLPAEESRNALRELLTLYQGHLQVDESGELLYCFPPDMSRDMNRYERLTALSRTVGRGLWKGLVLLMKVGIMLTLLIYFALFSLMTVALIFYSRSSDNDRPSLVGPFVWGILRGMLWLVMDMFYWRTYTLGPIHRPDREEGNKVAFHEKVFAFVFGPPREDKDPSAQEKRILAYIRQHQGRITTSELMALTGWTLAQAERETTRLMVKFDGDVDVTDEGVLVYTFDKLMPSLVQDRALPRRVPLWWDEAEGPVVLTGNTTLVNGLLIFFNGFNLLASIFVASAAGSQVTTSAGQFMAPQSLVTFGIIPLFFSLLFFLVPLVRAVLAVYENRRRKARNLRRAELKLIYERPQVFPDQIEEAVGRSGYYLEPSQAQEGLDGLLKELNGEPDSDSAGRIYYAFPRIAEEKQAVAQERQRLGSDAFAIGPIVYDTSKD